MSGPVSETEGMTPRVTPLRCFIVDDNPDFVVAAVNLLEQDGVTVVGVTADSSDALRRVERLRPDVTLIDVDLGGESGFDLAERLHEHGCGPGQPALILISAHAEQDLADMVTASPAMGFLSKLALSAAALRDVLARS